MSDSTEGGRIPLLPLRDIVVFPHMVVPLFVGRPKSIQALEDAMAGDRQLVVAAQRVAGDETRGRVMEKTYAVPTVPRGMYNLPVWKPVKSRLVD